MAEGLMGQNFVQESSRAGEVVALARKWSLDSGEQILEQREGAVINGTTEGLQELCSHYLTKMPLSPCYRGL